MQNIDKSYFDNISQFLAEQSPLNGLPGATSYASTKTTTIHIPVQEADASFFDFTLNKDKTSYTISAKDPCNLPTTLFLPTAYKNCPVTNIKNDGFQECLGITYLALPSCITSIDTFNCTKNTGAFSRCVNLTTVDFLQGSQIEVIGFGAFSGCLKLEQVYLRTSKIPQLGNYAFLRTSGNLKIYVPKDMIDSYKEDKSWCEYKDYIFPLENQFFPEMPDTVYSNVIVNTIVTNFTAGDISININNPLPAQETHSKIEPNE